MSDALRFDTSDYLKWWSLIGLPKEDDDDFERCKEEVDDLDEKETLVWLSEAFMSQVRSWKKKLCEEAAETLGSDFFMVLIFLKPNLIYKLNLFILKFYLIKSLL